jgi:mitofilin
LKWQRTYAEDKPAAGVPIGPVQATATFNPAKTTTTPASAQASPPATTTPVAGTLPPTGAGTASTGPTPTSQPPQPPPKKPRRRLRNFLLSLFILSTLGYAGGVYYSLVSDNFHDFFTEYIPFGEDAVGYFEEREFRRRFHSSAQSGARTWPQRTGEQKVTIAKQSGLTPRVAEDNAGTDLASKGRHVSAKEDNKRPAEASKAESLPKEKGGVVEKGKDAVEKGKGAAERAKDAAVAKTKDVVEPKAKEASKEASKAAAKTKEAVKPEAKPAPKAPESAPAPGPAVDLIDHLAVPEATEPLVQDVVKLLNNIITAVNASPEAGKYRSALAGAKDEVNTVIKGITNLKDQFSHDAEDKIKKAHTEFEDAAKELVNRVEREMQDQEIKWREEYEEEREKLSQSYQQKLSLELDAAKRLAEQTKQNELLEQEIQLQRKFLDSVRASVESEREGRLSKLDELSSSVSELENLTSQWNSVVDATLQTQHLHVALEAVRAKLDDAVTSGHPTPFLSELVALKEVSTDDEVVSAAIASIPPIAYQRGIPSPASLIDRFRRVASEVRKASLLPEDAGVASHAASAVLSRLMFAKKTERGLPEGEDVEATLARTEVLLEEGDLESAAREMNGLKGWAGVLSRDWVAECRRVLEVRQAVDVSSTWTRFCIWDAS